MPFYKPFSIDSAEFPCRDPAIPSPCSFHVVKICNVDTPLGFPFCLPVQNYSFELVDFFFSSDNILESFLTNVNLGVLMRVYDMEINFSQKVTIKKKYKLLFHAQFKQDGLLLATFWYYFSYDFTMILNFFDVT